MATKANTTNVSPRKAPIRRSNTHLFHSQGEHSHATGEREHFVQFYETDDFLLEILWNFIKIGLAAGDTCLLFATAEHVARLEEEVQARGLDLASARTEGVYQTFDADEVLAQLLENEMPVQERFNDVVESLIMRVGQGGRQLRIFGEMVVQAWTQGNPEAAIRLEELWNELHQRIPFTLLCAYPMQLFIGEAYQEPFTSICQQHAHVLPDESYPALSSQEECLRAIALLQQKAASLEAEITERKTAHLRLQASENHYRRLFENSTDGILMANPLTGTILDANPCLTHMLGYTREQLLGQSLWGIGLFAHQQASQHAFQQLQEQGTIHSQEVALLAKDGRLHPVEFVGT
ncbi:MAG: MEDS domain-containing protein, partial [Ktedonobacteraceae bacterium]